MVKKWTHGIDNIHGIDLDIWHSISTPESHTYERAECCPYAGFFGKQPRLIKQMALLFDKISKWVKTLQGRAIIN